MSGACSHEFFWPQKATNGRYYQSCRLCGSVYEYDWRNMGRLETQRMVDAEKAASSEVSGSLLNAAGENLISLRLLVEFEPAHRVCFQNLTDTLQAMPDAATLRQWSFWRNILASTGMPWRRFGASLGLQVVAIAVLIVAQTWIIQDLPRRSSAFDNSVITYYKPDTAFPALRGNPGKVHPTAGKKIQTASRGSRPGSNPASSADSKPDSNSASSQQPIRVRAETTQAALNAPDLKLKGTARPSLMGSNFVPPAVPLASTGSSRLTVPAGLISVVAPPAEIGQGAIGQGASISRRLGLAQASAVAPAPELGIGASSGRAGMSIPSATVIGPAPMVQDGMRKAGEFNIGPSAVVAPSPKLPMGEQRTIASSGQASFGSLSGLAVPPTPSASGVGTMAGGGRMGLMSGGGSQVVPPPPSIQNVSGGGGGLGSMAGAGVQVVPPAPSMQGTGGTGRARGASSLNAGLQGVAPAPSVGAGGSANHGGRQVAMNVAPSLAAAPVIANAQPQAAAKELETKSEPSTEEMPLRLIGLAMALPNSSYFSNYEVYIAERKLRKNLTELVKLVYVYLPYQRRLSEYGVDQSKVFKLLVSRDHTCDESLMQMTWPETDRPPDAHNATDAPGLSTADKKGMLPCYRTTADDYRKAMARR
jgi:hypothetical protein